MNTPQFRQDIEHTVKIANLRATNENQQVFIGLYKDMYDLPSQSLKDGFDKTICTISAGGISNIQKHIDENLDSWTRIAKEYLGDSPRGEVLEA